MKNNLEECITIAKMFDDDMVIAKNRDRNYKPQLKIVRDRTAYGVEVCYIVDAHTDWTEGMNEYGIGVVNSALFVKRDEKDYDKSKLYSISSLFAFNLKPALNNSSSSFIDNPTFNPLL